MIFSEFIFQIIRCIKKWILTTSVTGQIVNSSPIEIKSSTLNLDGKGGQAPGAGGGGGGAVGHNSRGGSGERAVKYVMKIFHQKKLLH
jgi:hypothetical protein